MGTKWSSSTLKWIARALSALYAGMWAVAWWDETQARQGGPDSDWFWQWAILTHVLPFALAAAGLIAGWKRPIYGVIAFGLITVLQIVSVGTEWVYLLVVVIPPLAVVLVYLFGWLTARRHQSS